MKGDASDPKALIREAFEIDGISAQECRTIFLDWALSVPEDADTTALIKGLLTRYADAPEGHPMTETLREGLATVAAPRRKGGRAARLNY